MHVKAAHVADHPNSAILSWSSERAAINSRFVYERWTGLESVRLTRAWPSLGRRTNKDVCFEILTVLWGRVWQISGLVDTTGSLLCIRPMPWVESGAELGGVGPEGLVPWISARSDKIRVSSDTCQLFLRLNLFHPLCLVTCVSIVSNLSFASSPSLSALFSPFTSRADSHVRLRDSVSLEGAGSQ